MVNVAQMTNKQQETTLQLTKTMKSLLNYIIGVGITLVVMLAMYLFFPNGI